MSISVLFLVIAVILFILAALGLAVPRVQLGWAGLAFLAGSFLVAGVNFTSGWSSKNT